MLKSEFTFPSTSNDGKKIRNGQSGDGLEDFVSVDSICIVPLQKITLSDLSSKDYFSCNGICENSRKKCLGTVQLLHKLVEEQRTFIFDRFQALKFDSN